MGISLAITGVPGVGPGAGGDFAYILRDFFDTDRASGAVGDTLHEPGPGTRAVLGTVAVYSISGGKLVASGTAAEFSSLYVAQERVAGRAMRIDIYPTTCGSANPRMGWTYANNTGNLYNGWGYSTISDVYVLEDSTILYTHTFSVGNHRMLSILRPQGCLVLGRAFGAGDSAISGTYNLLWPGYTRTDATMYAHPLMTTTSGTPNNAVDNFEILDMGGIYGQAFGLATNWILAPSNPQITTSEADGYTEITWTPGAGETLTIMVRRTDDDNCLKVECVQADGTIKAFIREGGSDTEIDAGKTQTWTAGTAYRVTVRHVGQTFQTFVGRVIKNNYATASFNLTATGVSVSGGATVANLATWPWTVTV